MNHNIIFSLTLVLINLSGIIIATYFYDAFLERKELSVKRNVIAFFGIALIYTVSSFNADQISVITQIVFIFYLVIAVLNYKAKLYVKIIASIFMLIFSLLAELLAALILINTFGVALSEVREHLLYFILGGVVSKLLLVIFVRVIVALSSTKVSQVPIKYIGLIISIPIISIYLAIHTIYEEVIYNQFSIDHIISCCSILYINLITIKLFDGINKQIDKNNQYQLIQSQLLMQQSQYKSMISGYESIKAMRHDMVNHLVTLNSFLVDEQYHKAMNYMDRLHGELDRAVEEIISGNVVVDALLNNGKRIAKSKRICFKTDIMIPSILKIHEMDLCTILGNAVNNALEACDRIMKQGKRKEVSIRIRCKKGTLLIYVENTYNPDCVKEVKGRYISSKISANFDSHGIGMMNMKNVIKKYNGNMKTEIINDYFTVQILLPNKEWKEEFPEYYEQNL